MFKSILTAAVLAPITFLPVFANVTSEIVPEYQEGRSFDPKLEALENCTPTDIFIHFSEEIYLEMHSASYLSAAIENAKVCDEPKAIITGFEYDSSSPQDNALTSARVEEVAEYMKAYDLPYESTPEIVSIPVNSALLNGLTVKVKFTYGDDDVIGT